MATAVKLPPALVKTKAMGTKLVTPFQSAVADVLGLEIPTLEPDELAEAITRVDTLLGNVLHARRDWKAKIEPVLKPLREAKQAADALNREIDTPLAQYETTAKGVLARLRGEERRRLDEAQRAQDEADAKIQQALEDTATRELNARTAQMRERLAKKREELEAQAEAQAEPAPAPVQSSHSTTRRVKRWRLADTESGLAVVLRAVLAGTIPANVVTLDTRVINDTNLETVTQWPGFEVYEDVQIVGRRG